MNQADFAAQFMALRALTMALLDTHPNHAQLLAAYNAEAGQFLDVSLASPAPDASIDAIASYMAGYRLLIEQRVR